jgi:4-hydroxy-2-oxoheptanedioate aldolase
MIESAAAPADVDAICAVPGVAGVYVGPADLATSMGVEVTKANADPSVRDAVAGIHHAVSAAGIVPAIYAGNGKVGYTMAERGFQMITLASEAQALRRGAAAGLDDAKGDR